MGVKNYTELETWRRAMDLVVAVYAATRQYPKEEIYGLTSQTRRSAVSIPETLLKESASVGRLLNGLIRSVAPPSDSE